MEKCDTLGRTMFPSVDTPLFNLSTEFEEIKNCQLYFLIDIYIINYLC